MNNSANLLVGSVAAMLVLGSVAAFGQDETRFGPETYAVEAFDVNDFIGTMEIIVEDRDDIEISAFGDSEHMEHLRVSTTGDSVEITYDDPAKRRRSWSSWSFWWSDDEDRLEEFPTVTVRLPAGTPVDVDGIVGRLDVGDLNGTFSLNASGSLRAEVGDVTFADVEASGSGNIELGDVAGDLTVSFSGSARFSAGASQSAVVRTSGSSDIQLGTIAAGLEFSASGSGDLQAASVIGPISIALHGSGRAEIHEGHASVFDVSLSGSGSARFGGTAEDTTISTRGSGGVRLAAVDGPVEIRSSGSGDVHINEGYADGFYIRLSGSGDVHFGGTAVNADISTSGSGDVTVDNYQGRYNHSRNEYDPPIRG